MNRQVLRGSVLGDTGGVVADLSSDRDGVPGEIRDVSVAVSQWVEQVGKFLGVVQATLEQSRPREDATAEVLAVAGQLPALIRQCRAQVPTPEMIQTWVQTLSDARETSQPASSTPPAVAARFSA